MTILLSQQGIPDAGFVPIRDRLCEVCDDVVSRSVTIDRLASGQSSEQFEDETWLHHANLQALFDSVRKGCHLCSLLYVQCCSGTFDDPSDVLPSGQLTLGIGWKSPYPGLLLGLQDLEGDLQMTSLSQSVIWSPELLQEAKSPWRTNSTASQATIDLARRWLRSCRENHKECSKLGVFSHDRPKRFLRLSGSYVDPLVCLVETKDLSPNISYVTLSHCWGTKPILKLTTANYQSFVNGLSFLSLSQTFRDTVQITMRLGFDLLWIDALCIIQDDAQDLQAEIPRMGTIYGNCVCTIAALSSQGGDGGCFADRVPLASIPCKVLTKSGRSIGLKSERIGGIKEQLDPNQAMGSRYAPNLHQRAWVVQERSLSPRTLYFSKVGMHWECCTMTMSEEDDWWESESGDGLRSFETGRLKYGVAKILRNDEKISDTGWGQRYNRKYEVGNWHDQWWHLVSVYTRCKLTHISDRWPAISGLATMFEKAIGSPIVSGIWKSRLMNDMLWEPGGHGPNDKLRSRLNNGYPTWSWISIDSPVNLDEHALSLTPDKFVAVIHSVSDGTIGTTASKNPAVFCLKVEAPMLAIPRKEDLKRRISNGSDGSSEYEWVPEVTLLDVLKRELSKGAWRADFPPNSNDDEDKWGWDWMVGREVWALQWTQDSRSIRMLIVKPTSADRSRWHRIGHFHFWPDEPGEEMSTVEIGTRATINLY